MIRTSSLLFTASLLVGCPYTSPSRGVETCPCVPGWSCDTITNQCVAGVGGATPRDASTGGVGGGGQNMMGIGGVDGAAPNSFGPAVVQDALAQCVLPHGPVASAITYGDKRAQMVGPWVECPPSSMTVYSPGIVFAADGSWNRLLPDGQGGLVLGYGVDNQGTYDFPYPDQKATGGNTYVTVAAASGDDRPSEFGDGAMTFETSPNRLHAIITYLDQTIEAWLVRLP